MLDPFRVLRLTLPTRRALLEYHRELERYCAERGAPMRIVKFMKKWEMRWTKKSE